MAYPAVKRILDVVVAVALLVALAPVCAVIALVIRVSMGRPVLFRQERPGRHAQPFTILKFRTMTTETARGGVVLADHARTTRVGRWLRSTSLDELPELINVVKGEMSLVGPRPLIVEYLPLYSAEQARRHDVRPGMTGLAQISGRNAVPWDERFELDVQYVDHLSFSMDLRILVTTAQKLLARGDPTADGSLLCSTFGRDLPFCSGQALIDGDGAARGEPAAGGRRARGSVVP